MDTATRIVNGERLLRTVFLEDREGVVRTPFEFGPDPEIRLEDTDYTGEQKIYPGVGGRVWEMELGLKVAVNGEEGVVRFPVIIIDSDHGKKLLADRFSWGKNARDGYQIAAATVAKLIISRNFSLFKDEIGSIFGNIGDVREHQILRAGKAVKLAPFLPGLKTQGDDVKRKPVPGAVMYEGEVKGRIDWGTESTNMASEICIATGANISALTSDYKINKIDKGLPGKNMVFNTIFISVEGLIRALPILLENGIRPIVICWEGIFNIYKGDVRLPDGSMIYAGTLISMYPDTEEKHKVFIPRGTYEYLKELYQFDKTMPSMELILKKSYQSNKTMRGIAEIGTMPDINGEVGEKTQDDLDIDVLIYDSCEFRALRVLLTEFWWKKISNAYRRSPGASEALRRTVSWLYDEYVDLGLIVPEVDAEQRVTTPTIKSVLDVF